MFEVDGHVLAESGAVLEYFACQLVSASARADIYEWVRTQKLLAREGLELDVAAQGKTISWVRIVRDDVFVEDEIWPTWFNIFHYRTRDEVVRRELLFETGKPLVDARVEESMRNLRGMGIFALVRIVAVRTKDPNTVGLIVHTRDLWSLRLKQDFSVTRGDRVFKPGVGVPDLS